MGPSARRARSAQRVGDERVAAQRPLELRDRRRAGQLGHLGIVEGRCMTAHHRDLVLRERPVAERRPVTGSSPSRLAMATSTRARRGDTPHCQATQCSGVRIPAPCQASPARASPISSTNRAVAALTTPHTSAIAPSNRATSLSGATAWVAGPNMCSITSHDAGPTQQRLPHGRRLRAAAPVDGEASGGPLPPPRRHGVPAVRGGYNGTCR